MRVLRHLRTAVTLIAAASSIAAVSLSEAKAESRKSKVVAYYPVWATGEDTSLKNLPTKKLTHLVYSFMSVTDAGTCGFMPELEAASKKTLEEFKGLKDAKAVRTILAIGGASNSEGFSKAVKTAKGRKKLVDSCVEIVRQYGFDGIDIDWEFPQAEQFKAYTEMLQAFRDALPKGAELSAAVPMYLPETLDVRALGKILDWFGIMAYDRCVAGAETTCHHGQFRADGSGLITGEESVQKYADAGARPEQILLGVAFYGYKWTVVPQGQKTVPGKGSALKYNEIVALKEHVLEYDEKLEQPLLVNPKTFEVVSFENERSLAFKAKEARKRGLGGIMIWEITGDDASSSLLNSLR